MVRLLITGSPGVGKTAVAMELSKALNAALIDINEIIKPLLKWDPGLSTNYVTDAEKARELIKGRLSGLNSYIIDTVAINLIDRELIDWCIVLRLNPVELMRRLLLRNWPKCKVVENVLAEVVGSSLSMAIDLFGKDRVIEVDTTNRGVQDIVKYIISHVSSGNGVVGVVDWLEVLDTDFLISLSRELDECRA